MAEDILEEVNKFYEGTIRSEPVVELTLENVTPALVGGWRGHPIIDREAGTAEGVRPTDVAGKLRWWLRAIFAGAYYEKNIKGEDNLLEIFKKMPTLDTINEAVGWALMGLVKGNQSIASKISIVVENERCYENACVTQREVRKIAKESPRVTLITLGEAENKYKIPFPSGYYRFKLKIYKRAGTRLPEKLEEVLKYALWSWMHISGIGSMVTRGYGRLRVVDDIKGNVESLNLHKLLENMDASEVSKYVEIVDEVKIRTNKKYKEDRSEIKILFVAHKDLMLFSPIRLIVHDESDGYLLTTALSKSTLKESVLRCVNLGLLQTKMIEVGYPSLHESVTEAYLESFIKIVTFGLPRFNKKSKKNKKKHKKKKVRLQSSLTYAILCLSKYSTNNVKASKTSPVFFVTPLSLTKTYTHYSKIISLTLIENVRKRIFGYPNPPFKGKAEILLSLFVTPVSKRDNGDMYGALHFIHTYKDFDFKILTCLLKEIIDELRRSHHNDIYVEDEEFCHQDS